MIEENDIGLMISVTKLTLLVCVLGLIIAIFTNPYSKLFS